MRAVQVCDQSSVPRIASAPAGTVRPFWSVMIPTYNCARFLGETLRSVLAQDPGPQRMQIEVVDDCSTRDDPESVVREVAGGRVSFFRQEHNVGAIANFNTCVERSRGEVVHILHGDDTMLPGFYEAMQSAFVREPSIGAAVCRYLLTDEEGNWTDIARLESKRPGILSNWIEEIAVACRVQFHSIAVRRGVYETIGGFRTDLVHASDWEMWKRIAVHYPVWYDPQVFACYRIHSNSDTSRLVTSGANIADCRRAIEIAHCYLPSQSRDRLTRTARLNYARGALFTARSFIVRGGQKRAALAQMREGLKCSHSPAVVFSCAGILVRASLVWTGRAVGRVFRGVFGRTQSCRTQPGGAS